MAEIRPTDSQREAIETTDRALMVEAGAGTGKTWVLVRRFMHLLETNRTCPLESIIAITFTEKAAREMRTRLRNAVERKAREASEDEVWQDRRRGLDRLQVSTIHSLCARILRENALSVPVDPMFVVMDEQESEVLKEEAIRRTLQVMVEQDHPALDLLVSLRVADLRAEMAGMLAKRGILNRLFGELEPPGELLAKWEAGLEAMLQGRWEAHVRTAPELPGVADEVLSVEIRDPGDRLAGAVLDAQEGSRALRQGKLRIAIECWLRINRSGGRADAWGGKEEKTYLSQELLKPLQDAGKALADAVVEIGSLDELAAENLQHWRALWDLLEATYGALKMERRALDFDDLELMTETLLARSPRPPRLQAYLDSVHHVMVDEYQDTNISQQQIVTALAPLEDPGRLFVVGDAKQSIYRFRQAQVSIFNDTSGKITRLTGHRPVPLNTSFRTHASLVTAQNALFDSLLLPQGADYAPYEAAPGALLARRPGHPEISTPVEILVLPVADRAGERISAEEGRILEARWLARRILDLRARSFLVWDRTEEAYRPFEFKDAAVLFRATTSLPLYEAEFKKAGLPYLTISGRGYYDRPEVQDLLALLAALANPGDDLNFAVALRSPLFTLSDETLFRLRWQTPAGDDAERPVPFRIALQNPPRTDQQEAVLQAGDVVQNLQSLVGRTDVWTLLRRALDLTGYEAVLARNDSGSGRQRTNVEKLLAIAREQGDAGLADFLAHLKDLKAREAREGEAQGREPESGAVQLMSIHASKGLEFPVVAVADLGRGSRSGFGKPYLLHDPEFGLACRVRDAYGDWQDPAGYTWAAWQNDQMEEAERRRLLYVAVTRAADLLVLSGQPANKSSWLQDILDSFNLQVDGLPEESLTLDGFAVKLHRPEDVPDLGETVDAPGPAISFRLDSIPRLARLLPELDEARVVAVTSLDGGREDSGSRSLHPALWGPERPGEDETKAPAFSVGNIVHRALAHWECVAAGGSTLRDILEQYVRQEGVLLAAQEDAVLRSFRMLDRLRRDPLFTRIAGAPQRFPELPMTLEYPGGTLHGVIDLVFYDPAVGWQVLDWKTGRQTELENKETEGEAAYIKQTAVYVAGFERLSGEKVGASLCYLNPKVRLVQPARSFVESLAAEVLIPNPGSR